MDSEIFDYGGSDDSSSHDPDRSDELSDIFGSTDSGKQRPAKLPAANWDPRVMLQVVIATILIILAGGLFARDAWSRRARDTAFRQMNEANDRREYLRVIDAAESFLTHPAINDGKDIREASVINQYSEALVHWVAQQPGKLDANAHARVKRYQQLVKDPEK